MDANEIYLNPQQRADDMNAAFSDPTVSGVICSIGGDDSIRILKYLDFGIIQSNPKFFMGYSDSTTMNAYFNQLGMVTFNGPSVMSGFSQYEAFKPEYQRYLKEFLFTPFDTQRAPHFNEYSEGYPTWAEPENLGKINPLKKDDGPIWLQGKERCVGQLFGGCIEVFEIMKSTPYWPESDFWDDKILFLETSSDVPTVDYVRYSLRNYGVIGVFDKISGLLFGRARDYSDQDKKKLCDAIIAVVKTEFGAAELPIMVNMSFGHTDPQVILPLGIRAELNPAEQSVMLLESPFSR